jgi:hypothetical protein
LNGPVISLRHNRRAYNFVVDMLTHVEAETMIVSHWATASVVDYVQLVEGQRPDVYSFNMDFFTLALQWRFGDATAPAAQEVWDAWLVDTIAVRPLCFVEPLPDVSPDTYRWQAQGKCWKLDRE